ncbi:MAG: magnetosome biogenesis CDF transporter MamB [Alphaproteobacteria bacterium]|nr:magnetosome biogenesis CDF transporter MamB [Alphaproteobacteria bacterium]MBF0129211.1 magnetosome biogenesis CDF transporter MamB [Alphaproteobacteria bacterium]
MKAATCGDCREEVVWWAVYVNLGMMVFKALLGVMSGSAALVADAVHSGADVVASGVVLLSVKLSNRKPNEEYPFGYGNIQFISSSVVGLILFLGALYILYEAVMAIVNDDLTAPSIVSALGAFASIIVNELMYRYQSCVGRENNSPAIIASAWDNRSDALSSTGVLIGILASVAGYPIADTLAAIFVAVMVAKIGVELNIDAIKGLLDASVEMDILRLVYHIAMESPGVEGVRSLRGRYVGEDLHIDLNIYVHGQLLIQESDLIAEKVRSRIFSDVDHARDVRISVTPTMETRTKRAKGSQLMIVKPS